MSGELELLRDRVLEGDDGALSELVEAIVGDIYRLAVRMVWDVRDAEDASQEILIKVVTKLGTFDGRSSLKTWVYRIGVNHLLDRRRGQFEDLSFDLLAGDLRDGLADPKPEFQPELAAMAEDVRTTCTGAMLLCLDRPHRVAYVLGQILELPGPMAAEIVGVSAPTFRKRLSRARSEIRTFMSENCGLTNAVAVCHCSRRVNRAVELGRIHPRPSGKSNKVGDVMAEIQLLQSVEAVMRSSLDQDVPEAILERWRSVLATSSSLLGEQ